MALYGGMMLTYSKDVNKLNEAKQCKKEEKKAKDAGGASPAGTTSPNDGEGAASGGSSGSPNVGGGGGSPSGPTSSEGVGGSEQGTSSSSTEGGHSQTATVTPSPTPQDTTKSTVTVTTTSASCEGTSISYNKTSDGSLTHASYVSCAASSQKASCMAVTGAMESSASGATGGSPKILATCVGATSTTESGTSGGTICGGIAVHGSNDSKSDDGTTAIVACTSVDAERSSTSKDGGTSRLVIQECFGVAIRKIKDKGFFLAVGMRRKCAFSKTKSSTLPK
ncbi:hypothetical protein BgAZ_405080 [Babesia gibsoni]|uniref:Uncharacterized protein n=1 Tax=Babesia gibsoni TaxID=33632 RepID=A0AAD8LN56_BABGI|nr:hypothetical protein BgAZ_405080 [Babesia gibsoni]